MNKLVEVVRSIGGIRVDDIGFMFDDHFVNITQKRIHYNTAMPPHKKIERSTLRFSHWSIVEKSVEL